MQEHECSRKFRSDWSLAGEGHGWDTVREMIMGWRVPDVCLGMDNPCCVFGDELCKQTRTRISNLPVDDWA